MDLNEALDCMRDLAGDRTYGHWADAATVVLDRVADLEATLRGVARGLERLGGDWPEVAADIRKHLET